MVKCDTCENGTISVCPGANCKNLLCNNCMTQCYSCKANVNPSPCKGGPCPIRKPAAKKTKPAPAKPKGVSKGQGKPATKKKKAKQTEWVYSDSDSDSCSESELSELDYEQEEAWCQRVFEQGYRPGDFEEDFQAQLDSNPEFRTKRGLKQCSGYGSLSNRKGPLDSMRKKSCSSR